MEYFEKRGEEREGGQKEITSHRKGLNVHLQLIFSRIRRREGGGVAKREVLGEMWVRKHN